jgi:SPP1 gp7 family putative phage head morphogenesis protein
MADRWRATYERNVSRVFRAYTSDVIDRVAGGLDATPSDWQNRLAQSLFNAQYNAQLVMVTNGYKITAGEFSKTAPVFSVDDFAELPFDFAIIPGAEQRVYEHLQAVSKRITKTQAKKIDSLINKARAYIDDKGRGLTPKSIAKSIAAALKTSDMQRARMIAITETMWSYNEGAKAQYESVGFAEFRWFATNDDVLCEHCVAMDGQVVEGGKNFVSDAFGSVDHPPLHPRCRCVLLPIVDEQDRREAQEEGDKLRAEFEARQQAQEQARAQERAANE